MLAIAMILSMQTATVSAAPTQDIDVSFSAACAFEKDLNLVYYCKINTPGDFTNIRLRVAFQKFSDDSGSYTWENVNVTDYTYDPSTEKYRFEFKGIRSDEMNNIVKCTLCANIGNQAYASATKEFSVKKYAEAILKGYASKTDEASKKLCTLMVDMLNYGAAAQKYFNKNTKKLANADLTEEQKAFASPLVTDPVSVLKNQSLSGSTASFKSVSLSFLNTIDFNVYVAFSKAPTDKVTAEMSYTNVSGNTVVVTRSLQDFEYNSSNGRYKITFDSLPSLYFRTPLTVVIKENGKQISSTLTYSYESYAKAIVDGDYTTEDSKVVVVVDGKVAEIKDAEAEVAPEEKPAEEAEVEAAEEAPARQMLRQKSSTRQVSFRPISSRKTDISRRSLPTQQRREARALRSRSVLRTVRTATLCTVRKTRIRSSPTITASRFSETETAARSTPP